MDVYKGTISNVSRHSFAASTKPAGALFSKVCCAQTFVIRVACCDASFVSKSSAISHASLPSACHLLFCVAVDLSVSAKAKEQLVQRGAMDDLDLQCATVRLHIDAADCVLELR